MVFSGGSWQCGGGFDVVSPGLEVQGSSCVNVSKNFMMFGISIFIIIQYTAHFSGISDPRADVSLEPMLFDVLVLFYQRFIGLTLLIIMFFSHDL